MKQQKTNRPKVTKRNRYKITNWSEYNQVLKQRGSLLDGVQGKVSKVGADGGYDKKKVYRELKKRKIKPVIPPLAGCGSHRRA